MFGWLREDHASTSSIGLAVATAFFATAFITAQLALSADDGRNPHEATLNAQAATALDLVVNSAGVAASALSWTDDPDALMRFGLTEDGRQHYIDYDKVKLLRKGKLQGDSANGAPDYDEVRAALGIDMGDFHLRSYPVLMSIDDARWLPEEHLEVAYVGAYAGAVAPVEASVSAVGDADQLNVSVTLTNRAGRDAVYVVTVGLGDADKDRVVLADERHTRLLRADESQTVWVSFHTLPDWDDAIDGVKVTIADPYGNLAIDPDGQLIGERWVTPAVPPLHSANDYNHILHAAGVYYVSGDSVQFIIDHYDKDGDHFTSAKARFVLVGPNGKEWVNESIDPIPTDKHAFHTYTCANCTMVGNYTAIVWDTAVKRAQFEHVHVSAAPMFTEKETPLPVALREIDALDDLVAKFDATRFDAAVNPDGDVFRDDTNDVSALVDRLSGYTTLVIGSEVSQTALTPAHVKHAIRDWVQNKGGNLVVLGTYNQQSRWLEPIYHAMQDTAGGGIGAPDPTHPILSTPEKLSYERYLDRGRAWRIENDQEFTHVLNRGQDGNAHLDTLAVSTPGAFNDGTVVLTSYMPGSLTDPQDAQEARRLLHNLVSQGHSMLFIDYGPGIPEGVAVGSSTRLAAVPHPNVLGLEVEVKLVFYLFG